MIDDFFASRGTLLNLVGMFLGNVSVVDRVQPEVIKFLGQDGTKQLLTEVLQKEWEKLKGRDVKELETFVEKEMIVSSILSAVKVEETVSKFLNQSVQQVCEPVRETIMEKGSPKCSNERLEVGSRKCSEYTK